MVATWTVVGFHPLSLARAASSPREMLLLYALYKQATLGPAAAAKKRSNLALPSARATAKWNAWKSLGDLPQEEAKRRYIALARKLTATNLLMKKTSPATATVPTKKSKL